MNAGDETRKRPNRMLWLGLAAALTFVLLVLVLAGAFRHRLRPENYPLIRPGMTLKQVGDVLGGPPGDYGWFIMGTSMMTQEGVPVPPGSTEVIWLDDNQRIEVYFDSGGRVVACHKRAQWERRPWLW